MISYRLKKCEYQDIRPYSVGNDLRGPARRGPCIKEHYLLHFVTSGHGTLENKYGVYKIGPGDMFIIRKGETVTYESSNDDPWYYVYINLDGDIAKVFDTERSVYPTPKNFTTRFEKLLNDRVEEPSIFTALLYELIYNLFEKEDQSADSITAVKNYIRSNYTKRITAESVSVAFGFERSYLYRMFKKKYGLGVKEYIIQTRMEAAEHLLSLGITVRETAANVGYHDEFNFSKAFRKHFGYPPSTINSRAR